MPGVVSDSGGVWLEQRIELTKPLLRGVYYILVGRQTVSKYTDDMIPGGVSAVKKSKK